MQQWMQGSKDAQSLPELAHPRGHGPVPERQRLGVSRGAGRAWAGDIDWSLAFLMSFPTTSFNLAHNEGERQQFLLPQPAPPALMS